MAAPAPRSKLNLEAAGLKADERGRLKVNENYQTEVPHVYAAGDVIGFPSLASTSLEQGRLAACHAFGIEAKSTPELFPYGIYTIPEISYVGKNEEELTQANVPYEMGKASYREIARGQIIGDSIGMLKILFHRETRELLGRAHHRRKRQRADPHRPGGDELRRKDRLLCEQRLQLSHPRRMLQKRRLRRRQPAERVIQSPGRRGA